MIKSKFDNRSILKFADVLMRNGFRGEIVGGAWKGKNESHDLDLVCRERDLPNNLAVIQKAQRGRNYIPIELYIAEPKYYRGLRKALRATRYEAINERLMKGLRFRKLSL